MSRHTRSESSTIKNRLSDGVSGQLQRAYHKLWPSGQVSRLLESGIVVVYPPEIWTKILHYVTNIPYMYEDLCEPQEFFQFAINHRATSAQVDQLRAVLHQRWYLKRVCKGWKEILEKMGRPWIRTRVRNHLPAIPAGTRRLDICGVGKDPKQNNWISRLLSSLFLPQSRRSASLDGVTTLAVEGTVLTTEDIHVQDVILDAFDRKGNQVRSLIYEENSAFIGDLFLAGLESSFSQLTSLTIRAYWVKGELTLQHVESVVLHVDVLDLTGWTFPSLKHYCLGSAQSDESNPLQAFDISLLPGPSLNLRSLLLYPQYELDTSMLFWQMFPALEFLGVAQINVDSSPPEDHPLRHLGSSSRPGRRQGDVYEQLSIALEKLPHVVTLITPYIGNESLPEGMEVSRIRLSQTCEIRGVTWTMGNA
ncbi:hypothetical protein FRC15_003572 [Serendipita sp. 397]|nr:hypothetical protein FRC15_003572 [Serendipita sp. 397]